jgi:hypothetical protein
MKALTGLVVLIAVPALAFTPGPCTMGTVAAGSVRERRFHVDPEPCTALT